MYIEFKCNNLEINQYNPEFDGNIKFLNQVCTAEGRSCLVILKLLWFMHRYVCLCVSTPSGMIWCDIGRV